MAQGCNLIYSREDSDNFPIPEKIQRTLDCDADQTRAVADFFGVTPDLVEKSILTADSNGHLIVEPLRAAAFGVSGAASSALMSRVAAWQSDDLHYLASIAKDHPELQPQLIRGFGNPTLSNEMATPLLHALANVRKAFPNCTGILHTLGPERGPGLTAWIDRLASFNGKGQANGIAYEMLMTAKMMSSSVDGIKLYNTDDPHFGTKQQGTYGDFWGYRKTTEADLYVWRENSLPPPTIIYIDWKYRSPGGIAQVTKSQLEHVKNQILDGQLTEAHFVTNTEFSGSLRRAVDEINSEFSNPDQHITLHNNQDWR